jgi:hypothetical protein
MVREYLWRAASLLTLGLLPFIFAISAVAADVKGSFKRTLKVTGPVDIELSSGSGDVTVRRSEEGIVRIKAIFAVPSPPGGVAADTDEAIRDLQSHPPVRQDGNHILVGDVAGQESPIHASIDYEMEVPIETRFQGKSGSGDLTIEGIRGPITLKAESGDIRLDSIERGVEAQTESGEVRLSGAGPAAVKIKAESGDVSIQLGTQGGSDLNFQTASGDILIAPQLEVKGEVSEKQVRGKVRGGGPPIEVSTQSGDIRLR